MRRFHPKNAPKAPPGTDGGAYSASQIPKLYLRGVGRDKERGQGEDRREGDWRGMEIREGEVGRGKERGNEGEERGQRRDERERERSGISHPRLFLKVGTYVLQYVIW